MLSVQEIEQAIERLPKTERDALESRLLAKRCGLSGLSDDEQAELLRSLDEAERDIDEGRSHSADDMCDKPCVDGLESSLFQSQPGRSGKDRVRAARGRV